MLKEVIILLFLAMLYVKPLSSQTPFGSDKNLFNSDVGQADSYFKNKDYQTALIYYEKAFQVTTNRANVFYKAACCASLLNDFEKAASYLTTSIEQGNLDEVKLKEDECFVGLKNTTHWNSIIELMLEKISTIETAFKNVKDYALTDLVPYESEGKWGYLHRQTLKVVVSANYVRTYFAGNCLRVDIMPSVSFSIDPTGKLFVKRGLQSIFPRPRPVQEYVDRYCHVKADSTKGFKGFRVNETNRIVKASLIYDKDSNIQSDTEESFADMSIVEGIPQPNKKGTVFIKGPYKIEERWYAIVKKNGKYGLIDEVGNPHPTLGFKYKYLHNWIESGQSETWFYFEDFSNNKGFISSLGSTKFLNEIDRVPSLLFVGTTHALAQKGITNGIIDLSKMEWLIRPIQDQIVHMEFTYKGECNTNVTLGDTNRWMDYFFMVKKAGSDQLYYIGQDGKVYKSK